MAIAAASSLFRFGGDEGGEAGHPVREPVAHGTVGQRPVLIEHAARAAGNARKDATVAFFAALPENGPLLNIPILRRGDWPDPNATDQVRLNEPFAKSNVSVKHPRKHA